MNLTLHRDPSDGVRTFGELTWADEQIVLQTLELPWLPTITLGGHPFTSCVPLGLYQLELHDTITHPQTWCLVNHELGVYHEPDEIPSRGGRAVCLIHTANVIRELRGCIAVGLTRSQLNGEPDVASSVRAFHELKQAVPWVSGHTLSIKEATP